REDQEHRCGDADGNREHRVILLQRADPAGATASTRPATICCTPEGAGREAAPSPRLRPLQNPPPPRGGTKRRLKGSGRRSLPPPGGGVRSPQRPQRITEVDTEKKSGTR